MRGILKKLYFAIIKLVDSIVSICTMCIFSSFKAARGVGKMRKTRDKRAFVLGNGPSLKDVLGNPKLLDEIQDGDSIVMNYFANSEQFKIIKPAYYILLDPSFFDEIRLKEDEKVKAVYTNLHSVDWDMTLFFVHGADISAIKRLIDNQHITVVTYNGTRIVGFEWLQSWCYKRNLGIPSSRNVIIPALLLMANIGYNDIILYGAEFSWTKTIDVNPENNRVFLNDQHFYTNKDVHYYDKGWYKWYLKAIVEMLDGVDHVGEYSRHVNVNITNRTKGSFIDAFDYENPDKIA